MTSRYRATINGFWCHNETWDDTFNWDGKHDEVFLSVNTKVYDDHGGTLLSDVNSDSELMGDTWRLPNRIQVGSASDRGGIISGDRFPAIPWKRTTPVDAGRYPPYTIWEGELPPGRLVMLTPTIWEWDPGAGFWDGWLAWQVKVDETYGKRAKEIFGNIWPVSRPFFDAISLGIQTVGTLAGLWSPLGQSMRRPIGMNRKDGQTIFNPQTIALSSATAPYACSHQEQGFEPGVKQLHYADDPFLRGVYSVFVQVERIGGTDDEWADAGHANGVVAMTASDGRLFCATRDNGLWARDAVHHENDWTGIGHANSVVGMCATGGRLFCATSDNWLWTRTASLVDADWTHIGHANGVRAMAAANGSLFCLTTDGGLWTRPALLSDIEWTPIGTFAELRHITGYGDALYGATHDGSLMKRAAVAGPSAWQKIGTAPQGSLLAAVPDGLFAATPANRLLRRAHA